MDTKPSSPDNLKERAEGDPASSSEHGAATECKSEGRIGEGTDIAVAAAVEGTVSQSAGGAVAGGAGTAPGSGASQSRKRRIGNLKKDDTGDGEAPKMPEEDDEEARKEFYRKRNAMYSRRKYMRKKIEIEVLQNQKAELTGENRHLKAEGERLIQALEDANKMISAYGQQAAATGGTTTSLSEGWAGAPLHSSLADDRSHKAPSRSGGLDNVSRVALGVPLTATHVQQRVQPPLVDDTIVDQQQQNPESQLAAIQLLQNQVVADLLAQPTGLATLAHLLQQPQQQNTLDHQSLANLALSRLHQAQGVDVSLLQSLQQPPSIPQSSLIPGLVGLPSRDLSSSLPSASSQPMMAQLQQQQVSSAPGAFPSIASSGLTGMLTQQYRESIPSQQLTREDQKTSSPSQLIELLRLQQVQQPSLDLQQRQSGQQQLPQAYSELLELLHQRQQQPSQQQQQYGIQQQDQQPPSLDSIMELLRQQQRHQDR